MKIKIYLICALAVFCTSAIFPDFALSDGAVKYRSVDPENSPPKKTKQDYFYGAIPPPKQEIIAGFGLNYFNAFGIQARYAHRFLDRGPVPEIGNALYAEGGVGMTFYGKVKNVDNVTGFHLVATGRWDFHFTDQWIFFGLFGLGYNAVAGADDKDVRGGGLFPALGVGATFNFAPDWALRGDLAYQFLGVSLVRRF